MGKLSDKWSYVSKKVRIQLEILLVNIIQSLQFSKR